jgi:hypothetical protein
MSRKLGNENELAGNSEAASAPGAPKSPPGGSRRRGSPLISTPANCRREYPRRLVHERSPVELLAIPKEQNKAEASEPNAGEPILLSAGVVLDVSQKGVGLILETRIPSNTELVLLIKNTRWHGQMIVVKVAWCKEMPVSNRIIKSTPPLVWRTGLMFVPQSEEQKKILQEIADHL